MGDDISSLKGIRMSAEQDNITKWNICAQFLFQIKSWALCLRIQMKDHLRLFDAKPSSTSISLLLITVHFLIKSHCKLNCFIMYTVSGYQLYSVNEAAFWADRGGWALSGRTVYLRGGFPHEVDPSSSDIRAILMLFGLWQHFAAHSGLFSLWPRLVSIDLLQFVLVMSCC